MIPTAKILATAREWRTIVAKARGLSGMHKDLRVDYDSAQGCWMVWRPERQAERILL